MPIFSQYTNHESAFGGLFVETYHITSVFFVRTDKGWIHRTGERFGQDKQGKRNLGPDSI